MAKLKIVSLFCGCGGIDLGLLGGFTYNNKQYQRLNTEVVFANDFENSACDIFDANFSIKTDRRDVKNINANELPECDLITGGFPCQSFSIVAQNPRRLGVKDNKGLLFFEMCRILEEKKPIMFIAENVKGILSANNHQAFPLIIDEFERCGYEVSYELMLATQYGVPQKRERVIICGVRKDIKKRFQFPAPVLKPTDYIPLKVALETDVPEKYYFTEKAVTGMLRSRKTMNKGRNQNPDEPCNTVGSHLAKVSLNSTDPVLFENGRFRRFTPREVARIQSFPENFLLVGSDGAQYRALGNAVPPVMVWHLAKSIESFFSSIRDSK